jgi:hypothetical protein
MALQFMINNVDYSQYVVLKKYNLQRSAEYGGTQYTDGWWKKHRNIVRHSISGTVTLAFPTAALYNDFVTNMQSVDTDGVYSVSAYVNNTNQGYSFNAFLTPTTKTAITPIGLNPAFFAVTLKVEEQ